jgi:hypothetical protein
MLNSFKHLLGLNVLNVQILQQRAKNLGGSLSELASEVPSYSCLLISDIAKAIILDTITWLALQQPHALVNAYIATLTQGELQRFTSITASFHQDIERLGVPGWMPKYLAAAIEERTFTPVSNEEDRKHQSAIAHFMAMLCVEEFNELTRWRLPKG